VHRDRLVDDAGELARGALAFELQPPFLDAEGVFGLLEDRDQNDGLRAAVLDLLQPGDQFARDQPVDPAQVLLAAVGEALGLLLGPHAALTRDFGERIDERDVVSHKNARDRVGDDGVGMGLRVGRARGERRIGSAEGAGDVAALAPQTGAHTGDLESLDREIAGFGVDEQGLCERLGRERAQKGRFCPRPSRRRSGSSVRAARRGVLWN
jgi:hypothetical protein